MPATGVEFPFAGLSLGGAVPLSEHEQRLLDQIERALYAEDPKFASAVRSTDPQVHYKRRILKSVVGLVLGICLFMGGVIINAMPVGIVISAVGFLLMCFCCVWGLTSWKRMAGVGTEADAARAAPAPGPAKAKAKVGFMERLEERWRRRHDEA